MSVNKEQRVSKKYARRKFNTIGLLLMIYALFVLIVPFFLNMYLVSIDSPFYTDKFLYFGIYLMILLFGTLIPFFLMQKLFKVNRKKMYRNVSASFVNLFVQTIVFFTICIFSTYVSNVVARYLSIEEELIANIGMSYNEEYLQNGLYLFMLLVVTPMLEEYAFRGVLLNSLGKFGKVFGLYASAFIFAIAHMSFAEMIPAFVMGVALGKTSYRYRSIKPTIVIHILFNILIYSLVILPPAITQYMAYGLAAIFMISMYFILSGKYEQVKIQTLSSNRITNYLFFTSPTVVFAIMLMIAHAVMQMLIIY